MVTTRRRTRSSSQGSAASEQPLQVVRNDEAKENENDGEQVEEIAVDKETTNYEAVPATASSSSKKKKMSARELRKMQREQARAKELGLIIQNERLEDSSSKKPKKIVFDSDNEEEGEEEKENRGLDEAEDGSDSAPEETGTANDRAVEEDDDDDDDAVEQMDSRVAKDMAMKERKRERETKAVATKRKPRHKGKGKNENDDKEGEEFLPEDFFAELDAHKSSLSKSKRQKTNFLEYDVARKHTIFQTSKDELGALHTPIEVNPGMELVVLEEDDYQYSNHHADDNPHDHAMALGGDEEPSDTAMHHSRGQIVDGSDIVSHKQKHKHRKYGLKPPEANWKRSKKMNRILLSKGKGKAAPTFVVKSYKF